MIETLLYTLRTNKKATVAFLIASLALFTLHIQSVLESRADLSGTYLLKTKDNQIKESIKLTLEKDGGKIWGMLHIHDKAYPFTSQQKKSGKLNAIYKAGNNQYSFQLEALSILNPHSYKLQTSHKSFELYRLSPIPEDLTGRWQSLHARIHLKPSEKGGWMGLLSTTNKDKMFVEFNTVGHTIHGAYSYQNSKGLLSSELNSEGRDTKLELRIAGEKYAFTRQVNDGEKGHTSPELLEEFNGVFKGNGLTLTNIVRHRTQQNKRQWQCEGEFRAMDSLQPIIGCGVEGQRIWLEYRSGGVNNPNFGHAYLSKMGSNFKLSGYKINGILSRVNTNFRPGKYKKEDSYISLFYDTDKQRYSGDAFIHKKQYRFTGRLEADTIVAIGLSTTGDQIEFLLKPSSNGLLLTGEKIARVTLEYTGNY